MNKNILIIGGGSDIGKALAIKFLKKDHKVVINIKNKKSRKEYLVLLKKNRINHKKYRIVVGDIKNHNFINNLLNFTKKENFYPRLMINNAAVTDNIKKKLNLKNFSDVFKVNMFGILNCCLEYLKSKKEKRKIIINISSDVSIRGSFNNPAYAASKAAIDNIVLSLNKIFKNSSVFSIILGPVKTKKTKNKLNQKNFILPNQVADKIYVLFKRNKFFLNKKLINFNKI